MCRKLLAGGTPGLHMYSLNLEPTVLGILQAIGMIPTTPKPRAMPWSLVPAGTPRAAEGVRPVCWAQRARSWVRRTARSAAYPGGAGGAWAAWAASPAGAAALSAPLPAPEALRQHTHTAAKKDKAAAAWGATGPASADDVKRVFSAYYAGTSPLLPWAEGAFKVRPGPSSRAQQRSPGPHCCFRQRSALVYPYGCRGVRGKGHMEVVARSPVVTD